MEVTEAGQTASAASTHYRAGMPSTDVRTILDDIRQRCVYAVHATTMADNTIHHPGGERQQDKSPTPASRNETKPNPAQACALHERPLLNKRSWNVCFGERRQRTKSALQQTGAMRLTMTNAGSKGLEVASELIAFRQESEGQGKHLWYLLYNLQPVACEAMDGTPARLRKRLQLCAGDAAYPTALSGDVRYCILHVRWLVWRMRRIGRRSQG